jgi:hypothetical protein
MSKKAFPYYAIKLDKLRTMKVTFMALMLFEEVRGFSPLAPSFFQRITATDLVTLLWASLRHEDKDLTLDAVAEMINPKNYPEILLKVAEAWEALKPEEATGEAPLQKSRPA